MGKRCEVCKKSFSKGSEQSYFIFPNNVPERRLWFSRLSMTCPKDRFLRKYLFICSNHFEETDIVTKPYGPENARKYLKRGSKPKVITVPGPEEADYLIPKEEPMSPVSEDVQEKITIVVEENSIKIENTDEVVAASHLPFNQIGNLEVANVEIKTEYDSSSPTLDTTPTLKNLCPPNPPQQSLPHSLPPPNTAAGRSPPSRRSSSSSRTLTCSSPSRTLTCSPPSRLSSMQDSESEHEMDVESAINVLGQMRNGRNRRRSYLGDYTDKDFDDPVVAKQAFSLAMAKIAQQRKQIKALQMERRRLNARVKYMKGLIKELQQREMDLMDW